MQIATFGSCLSRRTAERFKAAFGGEIVTSVYHNRSDTFLDHFVSQGASPPTLEEMEQAIGVPLSSDDTTEHTLRNICQNQTSEGLGKHLLPNGKQFVETIISGKLDVIIIDNYMDTAAFLWTTKNPTGKSTYFSNVAPRTSEETSRGSLLKPEEAAKNFKEIIDFIRLHQPNTPISFLVFPYNTYEGNEGRKAWALEFSRIFKDDRVNVVPPIMIPKPMWTEAPSHYKPDMYYAYAGMVRTHMGF